MLIPSSEQVDLQRRETHHCTPRKREAENDLRIVRDALGEWVRADEEEGGNAVVETSRERELEKHHQSSKTVHASKYESLERCNGTSGNRSQSRSCNVRIEIAIP